MYVGNSPKYLTRKELDKIGASMEGFLDDGMVEVTQVSETILKVNVSYSKFTLSFKEDLIKFMDTTGFEISNIMTDFKLRDDYLNLSFLMQAKSK